MKERIDVMRTHQKIGLLRELEQYGYRIAHYLLRDEGAAVQATAMALEELYRDDLFHDKLDACVEEWKSIMKKVTLRKALELVDI